MCDVMLKLRQIEQDILADGLVTGHDLDALREHLHVGGKINQRETDFLVELRRRISPRIPDFDDFYYRAIKEHVLGTGWIEAEKAAWLREVLCTGGKIDDQEREASHELQGQTQRASAEFSTSFAGWVKCPRGRTPVDRATLSGIR